MTMLTEADSMGRTVDYLDFMLWVVRSDGNVDARQKTRLLSVMVEGMGLRDDLVERYREALALTEWPEPSDQQLKSLAEGLDPLSLGNLVRDAYLMAWADGVAELYGLDDNEIREVLTPSFVAVRPVAGPACSAELGAAAKGPEQWTEDFGLLEAEHPSLLLEVSFQGQGS